MTQLNSYIHSGSQRSNTPTRESAEFPGVINQPAMAEEPVPENEPGAQRWPSLHWRRNVAPETTYGPLYVQERMSGQTFIETLQKQESIQQGMLNLFHNGVNSGAIAEPYRHKANWSNRLIRATAQRAMLSLIHKEGMSEEVDLVYLDPPYNISFKSQWQLYGDETELPKDNEISEEPAVLRNFRDNYRNGVHSYLDGLYEQLQLARQLLRESGSIIVQIGPDNLHEVALLMAEVFGKDNHLATIPYITSRMQAKHLGEISNWLIWYGKDKDKTKYHQMYQKEELDHYAQWSHSGLQDRNGNRRPLTAEEKRNPNTIPQGWEIYRGMGIISASTSLTGRSDTYYHHENGEPCTNPGWTEAERKEAEKAPTHPDHTCKPDECRTPLPENWYDHTCTEQCNEVSGTRHCPKGRKCGKNCRANAVPAAPGRQWSVSLKGLHSIASKKRLYFEDSAMRWQNLQSEHPGRTLGAIWTDGGIVSSKQYFVETPTRVLQRCILMTTDPGDLVLDLTCGSGAMPVNCENWGRRWISIDVSAVSIAIARERIALTTYDNHILLDSPEGHQSDHRRNQELLPAEKRKSFAGKDENQYRNDPAKGFVNDRQMRVSARTLAYGPRPDGSDVIFHPDRTLKHAKNKLRAAGPFTVESDSQHRSQTPEEYQSAENEYTNIQQHVIERLASVPIIGKSREYQLSNIQPAPEYREITHTAEMINGNEPPQPAALYIGTEDETVSKNRVINASRLLNEKADIAKRLIIVGFANDPEATIVEKLYPDITIDVVNVHKDLQLGNLKDTENDRPFTIIAVPEVRLVKCPNEQIAVRILGINTFDGRNATSHGENGWLSMMIDTDYDQTKFNCNLMNINRGKINQAKSRLVRALRAAIGPNLDPEKFEQMQTNESLPFTPGNNGAIALKVIDRIGTEHMLVIQQDEYESYYAETHG